MPFHSTHLNGAIADRTLSAAGITCIGLCRGQTTDFLLSAKRDAEAAKRFFRKALAQSYTVNPHIITVDKNAAYPKAIGDMRSAR